SRLQAAADPVSTVRGSRRVPTHNPSATADGTDNSRLKAGLKTLSTAVRVFVVKFLGLFRGKFHTDNHIFRSRRVAFFRYAAYRHQHICLWKICSRATTRNLVWDNDKMMRVTLDAIVMTG